MAQDISETGAALLTEAQELHTQAQYHRAAQVAQAYLHLLKRRKRKSRRGGRRTRWTRIGQAQVPRKWVGGDDG